MKNNFQDFSCKDCQTSIKRNLIKCFLIIFDVFEKNLKGGMDVIIKSDDVNAKSIGQQFSFFWHNINQKVMGKYIEYEVRREVYQKRHVLYNKRDDKE